MEEIQIPTSPSPPKENKGKKGKREPMEIYRPPGKLA